MAAFEAAMMVKSLPVIPKRTSLDSCQCLRPDIPARFLHDGEPGVECEAVIWSASCPKLRKAGNRRGVEEGGRFLESVWNRRERLVKAGVERGGWMPSTAVGAPSWGQAWHRLNCTA